MKMKNTIGLVLAACLISTLAMAADASKEKQTQQEPKKAETAASQRDPRMSSRRATPVDRQRMFQEMMSKRLEEHKKAIAELEEIKKIAEEENATRTAEAIQKMIDKKNAEFTQKMEQIQKQGLERPGREPGQRPAEKKE